jgi:hypothetical protein
MMRQNVRSTTAGGRLERLLFMAIAFLPLNVRLLAALPETPPAAELSAGDGASFGDPVDRSRMDLKLTRNLGCRKNLFHPTCS